MQTASKPNHIGRKIARIRELRGMKQETLADELGISQQSVSHLEQSENIEEEKLDKVAMVLGVPKEGIENFSEEAVFNIIGNTVTNHDNASLFCYQPNFNPLDKLIEAYEENKKLYERLVQAEKDKVAYLKELLEKK
ncbi:MAG TPA: helix-turn-helix transcriptional regulator [Salinimicrobium sp.]|nr:helix-turn-helix transcriptional regulator [Salinimicrobium sp.]